MCVSFFKFEFGGSAVFGCWNVRAQTKLAEWGMFNISSAIRDLTLDNMTLACITVYARTGREVRPDYF